MCFRTESNLPVVRGTIDLPASKQPSTFLIIEGLLPTTNYSLALHLQSRQNPLNSNAFQAPKSYVFALGSRALTTPEPTRDLKPKKKATSKDAATTDAFQIVKSRLSMSSAEESGEEDYDYEQDYEDSYDYEMDAGGL